MARKIEVGDTVTLKWKVSRVWDDGRISLRFPTLPDPITIRAEEVDEVIPQRPEKPVGGRRKFYDPGD
jgi:hypothetical protein